MNYRRLFIPNSMVFLTIVTSKRRNILIDNIKILKLALNKTIVKYNYHLHAICVLPNHIHMIIKPYDINDYPNIIKIFKTHFSKHIDINQINDYELTQSNINKKEFDIWQRRYFEHTITSVDDLNKHVDYIHYNPVKHGYVKAVKDWQYSSFQRFVNKGYYEDNWCNFGDVNKINDLNLD